MFGKRSRGFFVGFEPTSNGVRIFTTTPSEQEAEAKQIKHEYGDVVTSFATEMRKMAQLVVETNTVSRVLYVLKNAVDNLDAVPWGIGGDFSAANREQLIQFQLKTNVLLTLLSSCDYIRKLNIPFLSSEQTALRIKQWLLGPIEKRFRNARETFPDYSNFLLTNFEMYLANNTDDLSELETETFRLFLKHPFAQKAMFDRVVDDSNPDIMVGVTPDDGAMFGIAKDFMDMVASRINKIVSGMQLILFKNKGTVNTTIGRVGVELNAALYRLFNAAKFDAYITNPDAPFKPFDFSNLEEAMMKMGSFGPREVVEMQPVEGKNFSEPVLVEKHFIRDDFSAIEDIIFRNVRAQPDLRLENAEPALVNAFIDAVFYSYDDMGFSNNIMSSMIELGQELDEALEWR